MDTAKWFVSDISVHEAYMVLWQFSRTFCNKAAAWLHLTSPKPNFTHPTILPEFSYESVYAKIFEAGNPERAGIFILIGLQRNSNVFLQLVFNWLPFPACSLQWMQKRRLMQRGAAKWLHKCQAYTFSVW
jgi:hypothetical protein